ncbi:hypothetical protein LXL04_003471 [Taraxacum kok-saghyz]
MKRKICHVGYPRDAPVTVLFGEWFRSGKRGDQQYLLEMTMIGYQIPDIEKNTNRLNIVCYLLEPLLLQLVHQKPENFQSKPAGVIATSPPPSISETSNTRIDETILEEKIEINTWQP